MEIKVKELCVQVDDGYMKMNSMPDDPADSVVYGKESGTMQGYFLLFPISREKAMPFGNPRTVINGIHGCLADDQGLIEVECGKTQSGARYIYSIVKSRNQPSGVQYTLRADFDFRETPLELIAYFDETGVTGQRDAFIYQLARQENLIDAHLNGWMADPYSPDYKKGLLMNLSEQRKYDQYFPGHPLSELRRFLSFFIEQN